MCLLHYSKNCVSMAGQESCCSIAKDEAPVIVETTFKKAAQCGTARYYRNGNRKPKSSIKSSMSQRSCDACQPQECFESSCWNPTGRASWRSMSPAGPTSQKTSSVARFDHCLFAFYSGAAFCNLGLAEARRVL